MNADCRSELLTRVRRGVATEPDRLAFDAHLGACASCRMIWEIARDFDAVGAAEPGDAELLARIAGVAIGRAAAGGARNDVLRAGAPGWSAGGPGWSAGAPGWSAPVPLWPESAPVRPDNDVRRGDEVAPLSGIAARRAAASSPAASTAEQLFREANDARRAGSTQRAIELYRALQRRFAGSPEATLSLVSLGSLLLDGGSSGAALAQFDRYLGVAGARPLAVEALYGRGRALRALGRPGDEAQTWRRMLREHPSSPYAEHARRRLAELGG
ncbi:tetratricopeptide repeat protein [Sorangium sp. So ce513]|uniref:tetratricopeptide repeat protein n=1 Tax=Sorangium sp. So ce513 TaxID=3133315 RepID=UPI003F60F942